MIFIIVIIYQPTLSVPIHVVELTSVPVELRTDVEDNTDNTNVTEVKPIVKVVRIFWLIVWTSQLQLLLTLLLG